MRCFASSPHEYVACHNILRCTALGAGKCAYEKELGMRNIFGNPIETSDKIPLDEIIFVQGGVIVGKITGIKIEFPEKK